jgi:DNA polymerase III alpha subunit
MKIDTVGQLIFNESDCVDLIMQGRDLAVFNGMLVDESVTVDTVADILDRLPEFVTHQPISSSLTTEQWDQQCQRTWHMPDKYKQLDIAEYVLSLCSSEAALQRTGEELILYQERGLFDLLRFLTYLVDVMRENHVIWGVGRGSSVSSYVLYKLGIHRIDSMFYDLDVEEFLR